MKARRLVLAAFAVLVVAGLAACGGSSKKFGAGVVTSGRQLRGFESELLHPHRYTLEQVKAAFAEQGITLGKMRGTGGEHLVVLFDPRWNRPAAYHYPGKQPSSTYFVVAVHSGPHARVTESDGNVWLAYGHGEGPKVEAALSALDQHSKH